MNSPTEPTQGEIAKAIAEFVPHYGHQYCDKICPNYRATQVILSLLKRQDRYARLSEVENFEALDQIGTLERLNREVLYIDRRKAELKSKNGE